MLISKTSRTLKKKLKPRVLIEILIEPLRREDHSLLAQAEKRRRVVSEKRTKLDTIELSKH